MNGMKRIIFILVAAVLAVAGAWAQSAAEIRFDNTSYDLGTIRASKGSVKATYRFTNTGTTPLVILSVSNGGCGCTTPTYPQAPIAPGKSGEIVINFNPSGRKGELRREVKVKTNAKTTKRATLKFTGVIIP